MHEIGHSRIAEPEAIRAFPQGPAEIATIGGDEVDRFTLQPPRRWSR